MTAKELRNEIVNRLWSYGNLPKNIQTLMTDNEVEFVMEVIKTHVQEQLNLYNVSNSIAKEYAEFCVRCDRKGLPLLELDDYIKQYCC
jgi:tRNA(Ser,Leu) C12 N-acetylase TAN1